MAQVAVAIAVLVPSILVRAELLDTSDSGISPTGPITTPASAAHLVKAGMRVDAGRGNALWLTAGGELVVDTPSITGGHMAQPTKVLGPNLPVGSIAVRNFGDGGGTLYVGAYRGPGRLAMVDVVKGSVTLHAKVVTLARDPGWAAFYVDDPNHGRAVSADRKGIGSVDIVGYAADGTVLAHLDHAAG
jgi:hypothetical protein